MAELCLMTSSTYLSGGLFHQEQGKTSKEVRTVTRSFGGKKEMIRPGLLHLKSPLVADQWKPMGWFMENNQCLKLDTNIKKPVLTDVQDTLPDSTLFSFGIAEHCTKHQKVLQYLMSQSSEADKDLLDSSVLSDLMRLQTSTIDMRLKTLGPRDDGLSLYEVADDEHRPSLVYPREFYSEKDIMETIRDLTNKAKIMVDSDGRVLFKGTGMEMKDILSILEEFYLSKNTSKWKSQSVLIPHFPRLDTYEQVVHGPSFNAGAVNAATVKRYAATSPRKIKLKPPKKTISRKQELRDLYRRNSLQACESLMSIILVKKHGKATIETVKMTGPELPELLNKFTASIAGTGIFVLLSVVSKVACGRAPFCASKLLTTGFGFGLVMLSWAFNRLRDTVVYMNKNSSKLRVKEKEMVRRMDRNASEIFFSAATTMAMGILSVA